MIKAINTMMEANELVFDTLETSECTRLFWKEMWPKLVKGKVSFIDKEFPDARGWDWYDFMEEANDAWWKAIPEIWDRPYVIILHKDKQLMEYCEWDIVYYNLKEDAY